MRGIRQEVTSLGEIGIGQRTENILVVLNVHNDAAFNLEVEDHGDGTIELDYARFSLVGHIGVGLLGGKC